MSKPNAALKEFLVNVCERYLSASEKKQHTEAAYQMGKAHGALLLMTALGHSNQEGWDTWDAAHTAAMETTLTKKAETAQEVGVV